MDGEAFLDLAIRLSARHSEADLRTSVGRSYYGAFHIARRFVQRIGVQLPPTAEAHKKLQFCLRQSGDAILVRASVRLDSLRNERNRADYDLTDAQIATPKNAALKLATAKEIVEALEKCDIQKCEPTIRAAAKTLGLIVQKLV